MSKTSTLTQRMQTTEYGTRILPKNKEPKIKTLKPGKYKDLNSVQKQKIEEFFKKNKEELFKESIKQFIKYNKKKSVKQTVYENVIRAKLLDPLVGAKGFYDLLDELLIEEDSMEWVDSIPYMSINVYMAMLKDYLESSSEKEVIEFYDAIEDWGMLPAYIENMIFDSLEKRIYEKYPDLPRDVVEGSYLGDMILLLEGTDSPDKYMPELESEEKADLSPESLTLVPEEEKKPDIIEMPRKSAVKTIASHVIAGAAPGAITMNPEGAAVGAGIGLISGTATAIKDKIVESFTEADKLPEIQKQEMGKLDSVISMVKDPVPAPTAEECKVADPEVVPAITTGPEDDPELNKALDSIVDSMANLQIIDTDSQVEQGQAPELGGSEVGAPEVDIQNEVVSEEAPQIGSASVGSRGVRPGYYKNPIHEDALGLFFGSATNPNWNNALFYDRMSRLTNEDVINNKLYFYNQSVSLVNKYGVDFLVPSVKYMQNADPLMIIKENHEILQLYFKLKGIKPTEKSETYELMREIKKMKEAEIDAQKSIDLEDYQSGHGEAMITNKNPFRTVPAELEINPADAYEMRLLGNGVPIEARKTFKGEPVKLDKRTESQVRASMTKGKLPTTVNKNVAEKPLTSTLRFASEEEQCKNIFGIYTD